MQIKKILLFLIITHTFSFIAKSPSISPQKTVLIHPFGDANTIGRHIKESVERSITMSCAFDLKSRIESLYPAISVMVSRKPGEAIPFLQNAHFANCLNVDLFISLHFYQETETLPNLYIFHYKDNSYFIKPTKQLMLYPYHQAYLFNQDKTKFFAQRLSDHLSLPLYQKFFTVHPPIAFPAKPLLGIIPVATMIEMGIKNENDWAIYSEPLCNAIVEIIKGSV